MFHHGGNDLHILQLVLAILCIWIEYTVCTYSQIFRLHTERQENIAKTKMNPVVPIVNSLTLAVLKTTFSQSGRMLMDQGGRL